LPTSRNIENEQIDEAVRKINEIFQQAINRFVPEINIKHTNLITLSKRSLKLLATKKTIRRKLARNKNPPYADILKTELKLINNMTYNSIANDYNAYWERKFTSLKCDSNVFKNFKRISNYKKRLEIPDKIFENNNANALISNNDKANAFAKHFEKAHTITLDMGDQEFCQLVDNTIRDAFTSGPITDFEVTSQQVAAATEDRAYSSPFVKVSDVKHAINSRNNEKSSGNDNISNFVLKKSQLALNFVIKSPHFSTI